MYTQREEKNDKSADKTGRASRDYSRSATMVLDLHSQAGTRGTPRPQKWLSGNIKLIIWSSGTSTVTINFIDAAGVSTQAFSESVPSTHVADANEYLTPIPINADTRIIETVGTFDSMRIEYVPSNRQ